jgi:hypothetical protein
MSIATLKKKTQHKYKALSVGHKQFSLNGSRCSQGYIGQTSLSRSLPITSMRGTEARGHGGCCGVYHRAPIVSSAVVSLTDADAVKATVGTSNTRLHRATHLSRRPAPFSSTKPDSTNNNATQASRVAAVAKRALTCVQKLDAANYLNGVYIKRAATRPTCSLPGFAHNSYSHKSGVAARCAPIDLNRATHDGSQGARLAALTAPCTAGDTVYARTIGGFPIF